VAGRGGATAGTGDGVRSVAHETASNRLASARIPRALTCRALISNGYSHGFAGSHSYYISDTLGARTDYFRAYRRGRAEPAHFTVASNCKTGLGRGGRSGQFERTKLERIVRAQHYLALEAMFERLEILRAVIV
jgi:hypothetical protein